MTKKFSDLRLNMRPESQQRSEVIKGQFLSELPSHHLKQACLLSKQTLAQVLNVKQPSITKLEKRADMYISTLRSHIEMMGGKLEIVARFPFGEVRVSNFSNLKFELETESSLR